MVKNQGNNYWIISHFEYIGHVDTSEQCKFSTKLLTSFRATCTRIQSLLVLACQNFTYLKQRTEVLLILNATYTL